MPRIVAPLSPLIKAAHVYHHTLCGTRLPCFLLVAVSLSMLNTVNTATAVCVAVTV